MGCTSSSSDSLPDAPVAAIKPIALITNSASPLILYESSTKRQREFRIQGDIYAYTMKYCYGSQRGFYPDG